jgi:hypothetical protein
MPLPTSIIEYINTSGLTMTLDLYPLGALNTVSPVVSGLSLVEDTSRKGLYQATTTGLVGVYQAFIHIGATMLPVGFVTMTEDTSVHRITDLQGGDSLSTIVQTVLSTLIAGDVNVNVLSPGITNGLISLVIGDSYKNVDGRAITATGGGLWPDLTGGSVSLYIYDPSNDNVQILVAAGVISVPSGSSQAVYIELSAAQTLALPQGDDFNYGIRATLANGDIVSLAVGYGTCSIQPAIGVASS